MIHKISSLFAIVIVGIAANALAQTPPATSATTSTSGPATTRRVRWRMTPPPGFVKVSVGDRVAICDPADEAWVKPALTAAPPATKPSTMPTELIQRVTDRRATLAKQLATDFAISDQASIDKLIDQTILPDLHKLQEFHAPIYFMPIAREKLKDLVKGGWGDPKFYYNRAADDVAFMRAIALSTEDMDDYVMPLIYDPTDSVEARQKVMREQVTDLEASVMSRVAVQA